MKNSLVLLFVSFLFTVSMNAEKILLSETGREIDIPYIYDLMKTNDVLLLGEEHDDEEGHRLKLKLMEYFAEKEKFIIGMEFLERDSQIPADEYLSGFIDEKLLLSSFSTSVSGQISPYLPFIRLAKSKNLSLAATNVQRRYARIVSQKGLSELQRMKELLKSDLPDLQEVNSVRNPVYDSKLSALFGSHSGAENERTQRFIEAQNLWDAAMCEKIHLYVTEKKQKLIHINGRFHSDDHLGLAFRLKKKGLRVLTVSMFRTETEETARPDYFPLADIVWITGKRNSVD